MDVGPPGLSISIAKNLLLKITKDQLPEKKSAILEFLFRSKLFSESQMLPHFIVASCDPHHVVLRKGDDFLKKLKHDFEDKLV